MSGIRRKKLLAFIGSAILLGGVALAAMVALRRGHVEIEGVTGVQGDVQAASDSSDYNSSSDHKSQLKRILKKLYAEHGKESNRAIRAWIESKGKIMLDEGWREESNIYRTLRMELQALRRLSDPAELEAGIQRREESAESGEGIASWRYISKLSEKENRIRQIMLEHTGFGVIQHDDQKTPREVIEVLVEGLDDLTAAKFLLWGSPGGYFRDAGKAAGVYWRAEREYALEYAKRAVGNDPTSRDALLMRLMAGEDEDDKIEQARILLESHPYDEPAVRVGARVLDQKYPEEAIAAIERILPEDSIHTNPYFHMLLGNAYRRIDMLYEAADQYQTAYALGNYHGRLWYETLERMMERKAHNDSSIWEERAESAGVELADAPKPAPPPDPHDGPPPPTPPEDPPNPPADAERDLADAYAQFAEAYRSAFEAEYGPPADTPEGRMSALLGMARAFAKSGDAEQAQAAYNEARKRYTRGQVQEAFRRLDEAERLRRQQRREQEAREEDAEEGESR